MFEPIKRPSETFDLAIMRDVMVGIYFTFVTYTFAENYWIALGISAGFEFIPSFFAYNRWVWAARAIVSFGTIFLGPLAAAFAAWVLDTTGARGSTLWLGYLYFGIVILGVRYLRFFFGKLIVLGAHAILFVFFGFVHVYDLEWQSYIPIAAIGAGTAVFLHAFDEIPSDLKRGWFPVVAAFIPLTLTALAFAFTAIAGTSDRSFSSYIS